ncbi:MAG: Mur ligase domain-containing protein, partial [Niameybacter sp.]
MKLVTVLKDIPYDLIMGEPNQEVDSIIYDSRIKTASGLFIAIKGFSTDGHQYIGAAIENGAKTIVVEDHVEIQKEGITVVKVDNTRTIMARLAVNFYDHPSTKLDLVGVTGTNGKTSITFLLGQ